MISWKQKFASKAASRGKSFKQIVREQMENDSVTIQDRLTMERKGWWKNKSK